MSTRMNSMSSNSSKTNDPKAGLYTQLGGYVGFDSISEQIQKKFLKRGFHLNIILVGESGMGKSTFVNTLFSAHLLDSKGRTSSAQPNRKTVNIEPVSHVLKENGVKLRLTIVDTPGYGDQVNNERCWEPIITYIKDQHGAYLKKELTATRDRFIEDTRIHLCLFFISPTGHSLKPIDILVLQKLVEVVNVVPVIAKSDCLTPAEKFAFKNRIKTEIEYHGINLYPYASPEDDDDDREINQAIRDFLPFAIVGSELLIDVDGAKVRGRKTRWGAINVEDPEHCEFVQLREFITRSHLQDLIETTQHRHYESFRSQQIMAFTNASQHSSRIARPTSPPSHHGSYTSLSTGKPSSPGSMSHHNLG
ncbi:cell division control protein [Entomophthora muscae]|uniref:Cell division control protein n=1 Tax=Entomophthora muscae TaxID=34485 RepID=A0ACC2SIZ4_9FUNG|nr:cell division control protein [Entomophthora muscae]